MVTKFPRINDVKISDIRKAIEAVPFRGFAKAKNIYGEEFEIIEITEVKSSSIKGSQYRVTVRFDNPHYIGNVAFPNVLKGLVRNNNAKLIAGVGYLGIPVNEKELLRSYDPVIFDKVYARWLYLIIGIYSEVSKNYTRYGERGITINKDFHSFFNFYNFVRNHPDFDREAMLEGNNIITIFCDNDGNATGCTRFDYDTIHLVSKSKYASFRNKALKRASIAKRKERNCKPGCYNYFVAYNPNTDDWTVENSIKKYAKQNNLSASMLYRAVNGRIANNTYKGHILRHVNDKESDYVIKFKSALMKLLRKNERLHVRYDDNGNVLYMYNGNQYYMYNKGENK